MKTREKFGSRFGFILVSAGCAIGLGNVWKFPYMTGQNGGAAFILIYLVFLAILGLPIMVMEFSVGRASQKSVASSFRALEPAGTKWHHFGKLAMCANYLLMMFYTVVAGWLLYYCYRMFSGEFVNSTPETVRAAFSQMQGDAPTMAFWMIVVVLISFGICAIGLKNGVERITKVMMLGLLALMLVLVVRSLTLDGAMSGLEFYLVPDFGRMAEAGIGNVVFAAMSQAFFTLSIGIGSMAIFGSYLSKERSLTGDAIRITLLDTAVALLAGLIVIPSCFAFGVQPDAGPSLLFITLPNVFNQMPGGQIWGGFFFLFMSFAALSTVVAVFENILSFAMDLWGWSRKKAVIVNVFLVIALSMPCVLGFNVLKGFAPFGVGSTVLDLEDMIITQNLLPLGSLVYLLFCTYRYGWGWDGFLAEANAGKGIKFPKWARIYVSYFVPAIVVIIYLKGYWDMFGSAIAMIIALAVLAMFACFAFIRSKNALPHVAK